MFFDDKDDSEETQRLKNVLVFKIFLTNKERDEFLNSRWPAAMLAITVFVVLLIYFLGGFQ